MSLETTKIPIQKIGSDNGKNRRVKYLRIGIKSLVNFFKNKINFDNR